MKPRAKCISPEITGPNKSAFCSSFPQESIKPAHKITVSKKGSTTSPLPNSSIIIIDSRALPPNPPDFSDKDMPNQPNSAKVFQFSLLKPKSEATRTWRFSHS